MWPALNGSRLGGSLAAAYELSACRCTRGGCCSRSSTVPTKTGSHGRRNSGSPRTSASLGRRSRKLSAGCEMSARSSNTNRVGPGGLPGIGSVTSHHNLPERRAGLHLRTCPFHGAGWHRDTCPPAGHKDRTTHVGRSAAPWRALPGATRSLRSLVCSKGPSSALIDIIGRLAGRCPSGEEAQRDVALVARQHRLRHASACSRSCRLPAALAGDDEQEGGSVSSLADSHRDGRDPWGHPAQPQYARGTASADSATDDVHHEQDSADEPTEQTHDDLPTTRIQVRPKQAPETQKPRCGLSSAPLAQQPTRPRTPAPHLHHTQSMTRSLADTTGAQRSTTSNPTVTTISSANAVIVHGKATASNRRPRPTPPRSRADLNAPIVNATELTTRTTARPSSATIMTLILPTPPKIHESHWGADHHRGGVPLPPGCVTGKTTRGVARARGAGYRSVTGIAASRGGSETPPEVGSKRGRDGVEP